jgi:hypothetical protein
MTLEELAAKLRGRRSGHGWSCHCPSHDDKTPSLWLTGKDDGGIFVNCQAGCSAEQVLAALDQKGWLNGFKQVKSGPVLSKEQLKRAAFLAECVPVFGTVGERYLEGRGLSALPPSVMFHPKAKELMGIWYPAIVAKVQRPDGAVTSYQCTFLMPDGTDARGVFGAKRRQTYGSLEGGAVVFPGAVTPMVIAESWETAATVWEATGRLCLASLGLTNASKLELPAGAEVWLAGEADPAGSQGAETQTTVVRKLIKKGHVVRVRTPEAYADVKGTDWSDVAQREGLGAVATAWSIVADREKSAAETLVEANNYLADQAVDAVQGTPDAAGVGGSPPPGSQAGWLLDMNKKHAVVVVGSKTRILGDELDSYDRRVIKFSSADDFRLRYNNQQVTITLPDGSTGIQKKADAWLNSPARRQFDGIIMQPGNANPRFFNMWMGFAYEPVVGDWGLFKQHILHNVASGQQHLYDYIIGWMAYGVKRLDRKPEVALVLQGGKGTGKTFFADTYGELFGNHYITVSDRRHLVGNFNSHLQGSVLVFGDEAVWAGDKQAESTLKTLITGKEIRIEGKGVDVVEVPSIHRVILASNADWVVPASFDERRFAAFRLSEAQKQNGAYFRAISKQMEAGGYEAMLHELLNMDLSDYDPRDVPTTEALTEQKVVSMDPLYNWWYEKLSEGTLAISGFEFGDKVPTKWLHHDYLVETSKLRKNYLDNFLAFSKRFKQMLEIGSHNTWEDPRLETNCVAPGSNSTEIHRMTCKQLPPLDEARAWFEVLLGSKIDWGKATVVANRRTTTDLVGNEVPF